MRACRVLAWVFGPINRAADSFIQEQVDAALKPGPPIDPFIASVYELAAAGRARLAGSWRAPHLTSRQSELLAAAFTAFSDAEFALREARESSAGGGS